MPGGASARPLQFGKNKARVLPWSTKPATVKFDDVAGVEEAKEKTSKKVVTFLKQSERVHLGKEQK